MSKASVWSFCKKCEQMKVISGDMNAKCFYCAGNFSWF